MTRVTVHIPIYVYNGQVFVEVISGMYSLLASVDLWGRLREDEKLQLLVATYRRLGQPLPVSADACPDDEDTAVDKPRVH